MEYLWPLYLELLSCFGVCTSCLGTWTLRDIPEPPQGTPIQGLEVSIRSYLGCLEGQWARAGTGLDSYQYQVEVYLMYQIPLC